MHIAQTFVRVFRLIVAYVLMLAVMSYNASFIISIAAGKELLILYFQKGGGSTSFRSIFFHYFYLAVTYWGIFVCFFVLICFCYSVFFRHF